MQLTDFPIFQRFQQTFEFVRLNRVTIEFIPKYNQQMNQSNQVVGQYNTSVTGTLITAIDQVPIEIAIGTTAPSLNWANDGSNSTGTSAATAYSTTVTTPGYLRGLQGSKERELNKKHTWSFSPAFYTPILTGQSAGQLSVSSYQRNVKKWMTTKVFIANTSELDVTVTNGPLFYGPMFCFDVNGFPLGITSPSTLALFDVRMKYHMSFKRLRGV